ncbi:MAG: glycosyltransferase, partial [Bacteroidota bacterium]
MKVLAISFAKRALETGSREQERMIAYGSQFEAFHLIVLTDESDHLPESFTTGTVQIYGTNSRSKWGKLRRAITLGRQVCAEAPGEWVVSSQDPFETSFIARRIISAVGGGVHQVQLHGDFYGAGPWVSESFSNRLRAWYGRLVLRDARKIRVVSERIKQSLIAIGVEEQKIVVLPVAVSLEPFLAIGQARLTPEGDVPHRFMFVGRFAPEKRIEEILSAARLLHAHAAAFELTVVGDGPLRATLSNLIATYGLENVVHIKPWTNDLPALL